MLRQHDFDAPIITSLASSSHPSPSAWYSDASVDVQWAGADAHGLLGYSLAFDASPVVPTGSSKPRYGHHASTTLGDGIWYFSIAARDFGALWSPPASRAIRIDTTQPSSSGTVSSSTHSDSKRLVQKPQRDRRVARGDRRPVRVAGIRG